MTTVTSSGPAIHTAEAERHLLACIAADVVADFSTRPPAQRRLSAAFLEALISGTDEGHTTLRGALRIRGAEIVGCLRPLRRERGDGIAALLFWSCQFDSPVDLSGGDYLSLRFVDCTLPAFIGASLTTKADLDLSGSRFYRRRRLRVRTGGCRHLCNSPEQRAHRRAAGGQFHRAGARPR